MASTSNNSGMPKMSRLDKAKQQYKSAPTPRIPEMVSRNKEFLIKKRKISKSSILDADRDLEVPNIEVPDKEVPDKELPNVEVPDKEVPINKGPDNKVPNTKVPNRVMKSKEQTKQRILEWKKRIEQQKKEAANKVKPFLAGAIKVPAYYVPPPPLPKIKQKDNVVRGDKYHKQVSNIPKTSESKVTKTKKSQWSQSICSKKEKSQTVSKTSQPKSEAGPSGQSKLKEKFSIKKEGPDNKITEKEAKRKELPKIFDSASIRQEWAKRQGDAHLDLPSASGAVPSSFMRLYKKRKPRRKRDRRCRLETLEEKILEEEGIAQRITSPTKEPKDNQPCTSSSNAPLE